MIKYPARIYSDEYGNGYGIVFPDLPRCFALAFNPKEAEIIAYDALKNHLMRTEYPIPRPSKIEDLSKQMIWQFDGEWIMVAICASALLAENIDCEQADCENTDFNPCC